MERIIARATSRARADAVPEFANEKIKTKALDMINGETLSRKNPTTGEKEFLLFRGPSEYDAASMAEGKLNFKAPSSWTTRPDTARGYAMNHSAQYDADPIAAWVPESKIKNFLPANFAKEADAPAHSEVILSPIEAAYDTFQFKSNGNFIKKPFNETIGGLYGNPKKGLKP